MTTQATTRTEATEAIEDHPPLRVLGIAGSLRGGSYNRALLRAAQEEHEG